MTEISLYLATGQYDNAYELVKRFSCEEKWKIISQKMYNEDPKLVYTFLMYLVAIDNNEAKWQFYCYLYLVFYHPVFNDSMCLAAWHIKQALRLEPNNVDYKKQVISIFYSYSEQYFSDEEYLGYAKDVICLEPENEKAMNILKNV